MSRTGIVSLVRLAGFAGCAGGTLMAVACGGSEPSEPKVSVARVLVSPLAPPPIDAGSRVGVDGVILGAGDAAIAVAGVAVRWDVPSADGSVDSTVTRTNELGRSHNWYTAPTTPGIYHINAVASDVFGTAQVIVGPADVARLEGALDSIRFTRLADASRRVIRGFDRFGNAVTDLSDEGLTISTTGPFTAGVNYRYTSLRASDTLQNPTHGGGSWCRRDHHLWSGKWWGCSARHSPHQSGVRAGRGFSEAGRRNRLTAGVAVGESRQFAVEVRDSSGTAFPNPDLAALGVQFSSSDPTVADVSAQGVVRGVRGGTAQITAQRGSERITMSLPIVPALDLGNCGRSIRCRSATAECPCTNPRSTTSAIQCS